jgi:hypothetical protein
LIGVYSASMATKNKEEAADRHGVWHPSFIEEIIAANRRDIEYVAETVPADTSKTDARFRLTAEPILTEP